MKLIVLQPYLNLRGGVERVILKIAQHYRAKIYTLEYDPKTTFDGFGDIDVNVIGKDAPLSNLLPYRASQGMRYGYNFYNMKIKEDYDVLNPHISPSEWIRHKNARVLWYCHTPPREVYDLYETRMQNRPYREKLVYAAMASVYKAIAGGTIRKIERIATNSKTTNERIKKYYGRPATVVNPGIDAKDFTNSGDSRYFLCPSRIVVNKRQEYMITAFSQFSKAAKDGRYKLVIAGTLSNDPEHAKYLTRLRHAAKGLNVVFKTNVGDKQLKELYSSASAVLFAAINEDYGLIPLEAMASGKPIISVNEGGPRETVLQGKTGYLVNSPSEMAERMLQLSKDRKLAEDMGAAGRRLVELRYSWDAFFEKLGPLLKQAGKA
ncbi:MAG: glycosyltransferase [Candidatus Micrarchaeota archaeon]|nr:glycosyltransferase [Candidatus Micrarchaeota archaeon]